MPRPMIGLLLLGALLVGAFGWAVSSAAAHLYQDHLQVDQWRQEILNQRLQQLQQSPLQKPQ